MTWLHTPFHACGLLFAIWYGSTHELSNLEHAGLIFSCGTITGFGIGCVHEMIHSKLWMDFFLAYISMTLSWHSHFGIEHIYGHHRNVSTSLDCASSDVGDISWFFVPKCIAWTFIEACQIEASIVKHKYKTGWFTLRNRVVRGILVSSLWTFLCHKYFGWVGVRIMLSIAFLTQWVCDNTNYIEHYGLRRKIIVETGKYEIVWWVHSWDTPNVLTNTLLFKIQRHPDHHTNANRPYQILRTYGHAPQLPTGYAGMIVLSWFPPLWRWVMDPRVEYYKKMRQEYEEKGTMGGKAFSFPKERQAVSSHDEVADKFILYEPERWIEVRRKSLTMTPKDFEKMQQSKKKA